MTPVDIMTFEKLFLALADKTRLRLLALMSDGEVSVGYLADQLGESQPKISRHLAYLRSAGLTTTRRHGKWIYYGIDKQPDPKAEAVLQSVLSAMSGPGSDPSKFGPSHRDAPEAAGSDNQSNEYEAYQAASELEIYLL